MRMLVGVYVINEGFFQGFYRVFLRLKKDIEGTKTASFNSR